MDFSRESTVIFSEHLQGVSWLDYELCVFFILDKWLQIKYSSKGLMSFKF